MSPSSNPDPDSPFASFAQPKKSAVEQYKERTAAEQQGSKTRWVFLILVFAGTVLGAVAAIAVGVGLEHVPLALGYANASAFVGVLIGWLLALVAWSTLLFRSKQSLGFNVVERDLVQGNRWSRLFVWMTAWAAIGSIVGAALGATLATRPPDYDAMEHSLGWGMGGATLGLVLTVTAWFVIRRAERANDAPVQQ